MKSKEHQQHWSGIISADVASTIGVFRLVGRGHREKRKEEIGWKRRS